MIYGFGVNDVPKKTWDIVNGKRVINPYYDRWKNLIRRCYSEKLHIKRPNYANTIVSEEWKYFSIFKEWMVLQNWKGMHLDKDLIGNGKEYSKDTCLFIHPSVNTFITDRCNYRNAKLPIGVYLENNGKYKSHINDFNSGKTKYLGVFDTPEEAFNCWFKNKLIEAKKLMGLQGAEHLESFYERNYNDYLTGKK